MKENKSPTRKMCLDAYAAERAGNIANLIAITRFEIVDIKDIISAIKDGANWDKTYIINKVHDWLKNYFKEDSELRDKIIKDFKKWNDTL